MAQEKTEVTGRRERTRMRKSDELVSTALRIVREEGVDALTTHRIAKELDVAVGGIYRYFPSKAAIVAELERRALDGLRLELMASVERCRQQVESNPALPCLVIAARGYADFSRKNPAEFGLLSQILADPRTLVPTEEVEPVLTAMIALLTPIVQLFEEAVQENTLHAGNSLERAVLLWSGLRGVLELRKLRKHQESFFDADELATNMFRGLLVGWGATPTAVDRAFALATSTTTG